MYTYKYPYNNTNKVESISCGCKIEESLLRISRENYKRLYQISTVGCKKIDNNNGLWDETEKGREVEFIFLAVVSCTHEKSSKKQHNAYSSEKDFCVA